MTETPPELHGAALAKWTELIEDYEVNVQTRDILIAICKCHARFLEAEEQLVEKGMLYKNPSGKIEPSPMLAISGQMQEQLKKHFEYLKKIRKY